MNLNQNYNQHKVAFITGITGQIAPYLAEYLLDIGYGKVVGMTRRSSNPHLDYLTNCIGHPNFSLEMFDLTDPFSIMLVFNKYIRDIDLQYEIYNLAAMSHVHVSFKQPKFTADVVGLGHLNILEAAKSFHEQGFKVSTYFMASSEMFGSQRELDGFQNLNTKLWPNSPYACAKIYAFHLNHVYRESWGMRNSAGIIFNTESPRRGIDFVTRKITNWFANFAHTFSLQPKLQLGNINSYRDWTHARDTVRAIHLIATAQRPKDYVVASGETHSIKNFLESTYKIMELRVGKCPYDLKDMYEINQEFIRPNDVEYLCGQADIIRKELGWKPTISFQQLVEEMFISDYEQIRKAKLAEC